MAVISGDILTFQAMDAPLASLVVNFECVQEGEGDSSPTNVRPITVWDGVTITHCGKNFIRYPYNQGSRLVNHGVEFVVNDDGTIVANGTAEGSDAQFFLRSRSETNPCYLPKGNFILTGCPPGGSESTYTLRVNETRSSMARDIAIDEGEGASITIDDTNVNNPKGVFIKIAVGTTVENLVFKPMIKFGEIEDETRVHTISDVYLGVEDDIAYVTYMDSHPIADSYEVYKGYYTYENSWETETGGIAACGTYDAVAGKLIVTHMYMEFDGDENWTSYGQGYRVPIVNRGIEYHGLCGNWLKPAPFGMDPTSASSSVANTFFTRTNYLYVIVPDAANVTALKAMMTSEPLQVVYELETPIEFYLTPTTVNTILGTNHMWADAGNLTLSYVRKTAYPQVRFGDVFSFDDLKLYYDEQGSSKDTPTPQKTLIKVPYRNGLLNATPALTDKVFYENRKISLHFLASYFDVVRYEDLCSKVNNAIHGQSFDLVLYTDPDYYWTVYDAVVGQPSQNDGIVSFTIDLDCYPYKLKRNMTTKTITVNGTGIVEEFQNGRMEVNPTFVTDQEVQVQWTGRDGTLVTIAMSAGTHTYDNIEFYEGRNLLTFNKISANATVEVSYREGDL